MSTAEKRNVEIVRRYTDQPERLPLEMRRAMEAACGGEPVQLYALADLDESMSLARIWVALTPRHLVMAGEREGSDPEMQVVERCRVTGVRSRQGLSCSTLTVLGGSGEPELAVVRYTHRQRRAMENLVFVLEQGVSGREVAVGDADAVYADALARPVRGAQAAVSVNRMAVIRRLMGYLRPYRRTVTWGMVAAAGMTLLSLVPPYVMRQLIDGALRPARAGDLSWGRAGRTAWLAVGAVAATYMLRQVCAWVRLRYMAILGENVARDLRTELYEHLQCLSLSYYSKTKTGSIISRVTSDIDRLWHFIAFGVVNFSLSVVMLVGLGAVLICLDWRLGLVMTLPVPLLFWGLYRHSETMGRLCLRAWRKWSGLTGFLSDTIAGVRVVKAFSRETSENQRFRQKNYDITEEFNRLHLVWTAFWPKLMGAVRGLMIVVWILALPRVMAPEGADVAALSIGTFVSFVLYMTMFTHPVEEIGTMTNMINRATSSANRVFQVLDTEPEIRAAAEPVRLERVEGRVQFRDVTFAYDGIHQVLRGVSFDVSPGEMIGLVGPSGAGKTTVINLIVRFYDATDGRVLIDGQDVRDLDLEDYRRQVGMVLQDPYLFHGSILDNIRYGLPEADPQRVIAAARAAGAHDFVCKLPHGYETVVGERGQTLSGGERQRISIARAVLSDPRILILDEATSSVDTQTEREIQEALEQLVAGRTTFAIAHRLSTLKRASRLFVVEDGRIAEEGTHEELLAREDGTYRRLCEMQRELTGSFAV
ncbi:MAG: ABC transporter ATP-binding protein [Planctomycetota bacterium]|jgi:ATP-binding cassette subfamily B protein